LKEIHIYKKSLNQLPFPKRKNHKKEEMVVVTMKEIGK
jgi:hypothetical protein